MSDKLASRTAFVSRLWPLLLHRRLPIFVALVAIALTLPSLQVGLLFDDYHHKLLMTGLPSPIRLLQSPLDLFRFFDGDREKNAQLIEYGALPWWSYVGVRGAFWRPLASMTHWLDYTLWPAHPAMMHLQSVCWYGLAVFVVALLYREVMGLVPAAGLAALLFAIDDAHATPVAFLSNRSDLPAIVFGVLCLMAHHRWRQDGKRWAALAAPILLLASALSKEAGVSTCAYLAAYELFLDRSRRRDRLLALLPYLVVVLVWRLTWSRLGYGVEELGIYVDPLRAPVRFLAAVVERGPILLLGQWATPPADLSLLLGARNHQVLWSAAIIFLVLLGVLFAPMIRRDCRARFWACGMLLSVIPACATFPSDRMLMFTGIGAMALLAEFLAGLPRAVARGQKMRLFVVFGRTMTVGLIVVHLVAAPLLLLGRSAAPAGPKWLRGQLYMVEPLDESIRNQDLVVVNPPEAFGILGSLLTWAGENEPLPRHARILASSAMMPVRLYRPDARTLIVRPEAGYLAGMLDRLFRGEWRPFARGDRIVLPGMTVVVTDVTADGRPAEARFEFSVPLEDASLRWIYWNGGKFLPFSLPKVGEEKTLESRYWLAGAD